MEKKWNWKRIFNRFKCRLIYKGDFLNGERNGKGKEFNNNGYLIFKGKFLNGKRLDEEEKNIMMMAI